MALKIQDILNDSSALDGSTSSSPATFPPSLTFARSPRASSQALTAPHGTQATLSTLPTSHAPGRPQQPQAHLQASRSPNTQPSWSLPSPKSETASSWSEAPQRPGTWGSLFGVGGQQAFMALPGSDTPIPVHMDFSQASKKADERRQRNAVASTRHRRKKKIMQAENSKQLQELRDKKRMMEIMIEELTQQRDFYRENYNHLRYIITETPSISCPAVGPPSPTFSTSNSYAGTGSLASGPFGSIGYCSDMISSERPIRCRRTDNHPECSLPPYGSPASGRQSAFPSGLHPMLMPKDSTTISAASSARGKGLPALTAMGGQPPGPSAQEQDPQTGQWISVQPRVPEIGQATRDTHRRP